MSHMEDKQDEKVPLTCSNCDIGFSFDSTDVCDYCGGRSWEVEPGYE